ncbi:MAG: hypothetical protein A3F46_04615, partial [Legionellales bacterium RIFCSPHIGHO2_12_FULL_42_9]
GDIYAEFAVWLREHVKEMLQFSGFIQASIFKQEQDKGSDQEKLTVQYQIESRDDLQCYFTEFAAQMREEGIKRFKDKFSAERRIFNVQDTMTPLKEDDLSSDTDKKDALRPGKLPCTPQLLLYPFIMAGKLSSAVGSVLFFDCSSIRLP